MAWLASKNLLPFVIERYRAGRKGPMGHFFWLSCQSDRPLESEGEALAVIANCEAFAALGEQPSIELDLAVIGPRKRMMERTLWNIDLLALQSLERLGSSPFLKEEWSSNFIDLKARLDKVSARYEAHRQTQSQLQN